MSTTSPTVEQVRAALKPLTLHQLGELSRLSGVPKDTIYKIRLGGQSGTPNPGMLTVEQFWPHVRAARKSPTKPRKAQQDGAHK